MYAYYEIYFLFNFMGMNKSSSILTSTSNFSFLWPKDCENSAKRFSFHPDQSIILPLVFSGFEVISTDLESMSLTLCE